MLRLIAAGTLGPVGTVAGQPLVGIVGAITWVGLTTLLTATTSAGAGTTMAIAGALLGLGAAAGGAAGGLLLAVGGYNALAVGLSGVVLAAALLTTGVGEDDRRVTSGSEAASSRRGRDHDGDNLVR